MVTVVVLQNLIKSRYLKLSSFGRGRGSDSSSNHELSPLFLKKNKFFRFFFRSVSTRFGGHLVGALVNVRVGAVECGMASHSASSTLVVLPLALTALMSRKVASWATIKVTWLVASWADLVLEWAVEVRMSFRLAASASHVSKAANHLAVAFGAANLALMGLILANSSGMANFSTACAVLGAKVTILLNVPVSAASLASLVCPASLRGMAKPVALGAMSSRALVFRMALLVTPVANPVMALVRIMAIAVTNGASLAALGIMMKFHPFKALLIRNPLAKAAGPILITRLIT